MLLQRMPRMPAWQENAMPGMWWRKKLTEGIAHLKISITFAAQ